MKNILLIKGGKSSEYEISLISSKFIKKNIEENFNILEIEITKSGKWIDSNSNPVSITSDGFLLKENDKIKIDYAIPYMHGYPAETGDIQSIFELYNIPYFGVESEPSKVCFNKVTTKLWLEALNINNTPFIFANDLEDLPRVKGFFEIHKDIFIKAASQGSSVGCYHVKESSEIENNLKEAFNYSSYVLIEKTVKGRELEVSAFDYQGKLHITKPGEIITGEQFYTYEEKYAESSQSKTEVEAKDLTTDQINEIQSMATKAYKGLKLRHLSRIDFFLSNEGKIYLNEVNTYPGLTPISMFPVMMENYGIKFKDYILDCINRG